MLVTEILKEITLHQSITLKFAGNCEDNLKLAGSMIADAAFTQGYEINKTSYFQNKVISSTDTPICGDSGFRVQFGKSIDSSNELIMLLIAMNPAALKENLHLLAPKAVILVNSNEFDELALAKAGFTSNPLTSGILDNFHVINAPINSLLTDAFSEIPDNELQVYKCRNMFTFGAVTYLLSFEADYAFTQIEHVFGCIPMTSSANKLSFILGYQFGIRHKHFREGLSIVPIKKR